MTIKVRTSNFEAVTRSTPEIAARAAALLDRTEAGCRPVRLFGVTLHGIIPSPRESGRILISIFPSHNSQRRALVRPGFQNRHFTA
ncbi:MAG: hypothetical protein HY716_06090 [Planctomycetes bacterium]|nr:hypothetical protein [Planctomycetota bacterium]